MHNELFKGVFEEFATKLPLICEKHNCRGTAGAKCKECEAEATSQEIAQLKERAEKAEADSENMRKHCIHCIDDPAGALCKALSDLAAASEREGRYRDALERIGYYDWMDESSLGAIQQIARDAREGTDQPFSLPAFQRGQEVMREKAANIAYAEMRNMKVNQFVMCDTAEAIRSIPLEGGK